jgi:hypothetical protein
VTDWRSETGKDLASAVVSIGRQLWRDDSGRRSRMLANVARYESQQLASLSPEAYRNYVGPTTGGQVPVHWNVARSIVATATAEIAASQQPKVTFVASNADWSTRRKGPKLDSFITGLWSTRQEPYADIWEMGTFAFRDAAICGLGAIKIWSDIDAGRVIHEKPFPWELLTDPRDARHGSPSTLFQVYSAPLEFLRAVFPEASEDLANAKTSYSEDDESEGMTVQGAPASLGLGGQHVVEMVRCYEMWTLPTGKESPGKHVLAFDGGILIEDEWKRESFPFAMVRWDRKFQGFEGTSLIDETAAVDDEMNELLARISTCVRLTSMAICWKRDDCEVSGDLVTNKDCLVMNYTGPTPPVTSSPSPFGPEHIQYLQMLKQAEFELSGVNQMTATAQKQPGIEAASAIRLVSDIQSKRFAVAFKAYQAMFVDIARHDIACVRELAEDDTKFAVKWPGSGFLKTIEWKTVDLQDDLYVIQIASAPGIKGTPADRLQSAQEMFASGRLSAESLQSVQRYLDLPGEVEKSSKQRDLIDRYIERWLDASDEELALLNAGKTTNFFRPPNPRMRLEDALLQVNDAYLAAEFDEAPDEILDVFNRWIELCNAEIEKKQRRAAAVNQPPPAPLPAGATPVAAGGPLA